jgi:hypothetical protein
MEEYISPIPNQFLRTNDPPLSTGQQRQLLDSLEKSRRDLHEVDDTIAYVQDILGLLQHRRRGIEQSIALNKGGLSAVRRLPGEVLAAIFIEAIDMPQVSLSGYEGRLVAPQSSLSYLEGSRLITF